MGKPRVAIHLNFDYVKAPSLASLAISDSFWRHRWIPTSSWGQYTDGGGDGLNQQAERNHQQRKSCAWSVDVGLEPRFVWHAGEFGLINRLGIAEICENV